MSRGWPEHLWIVRHGQSAGNVARDAAVTGKQHNRSETQSTNTCLLLQSIALAKDVPLSVPGLG